MRLLLGPEPYLKQSLAHCEGLVWPEFLLLAVAPRKMRELQAPGGLHHGRLGQTSLRGPAAVVHGRSAPGVGLQAAMQERPAQPA